LALIVMHVACVNRPNTESCELPHSFRRPFELRCGKAFDEGGIISKDDRPDDQKTLRQDTVEPEVVFVKGIVHDEVLQRCSFAADDLSRARETQVGTLDLRPGDVAANEAFMPEASVRVRFDDAGCVSMRRSGSGWAPFLWMRIKAYFSI
jgi:hypothetical protein